MRKFFAHKRIYQLILTFCTSLLALPCYAGVIYETTFDSNANWNTTGALNKDCGSTSCSDQPTGWSNYYSVPPVGNLAVTVQPIPDGSADHTGGTAKKAYVAYYNNVTYSGGQELSKTFSQDYPEIYARVWVKAQPGWQTAADSSIKLWRIGHWDRTGSAFAYFSGGNGGPLAGMNWATNSAYRGTDGCYILWGRFDPQETAYYPPASSPLANDTPYRLLSGVTPSGAGGFADGKWHRYDLHVKMNTQSGSTWNVDGIYEFWYDGKLIVSYNNISWLNSGSPTGTGWNSIQLGGNSNNPYSGGVQWAAFDDVVVSTTPIPDTYVIGGATATPPAPPQNPKGVVQ